jgi:tetratricopeptide (TPR) repeat protein
LLARPQEALIHKNLGEALAAKGKLDEAMGEYRRALVLTNDPATHYSLGLTLAVGRRWEPAIEQFSETVRLSPTNAEAHYNLGYAFLMKGKPDEAEAHLREALRFRPELPLAHYNLGCVLADKGQKEEAITHLKEAARQKPDYAEAAEKVRALEARP